MMMIRQLQKKPAQPSGFLPGTLGEEKEICIRFLLMKGFGAIRHVIALVSSAGILYLLLFSSSWHQGWCMDFSDNQVSFQVLIGIGHGVLSLNSYLFVNVTFRVS
jgi:hypothetical protein